MDNCQIPTLPGELDQLGAEGRALLLRLRRVSGWHILLAMLQALVLLATGYQQIDLWQARSRFAARLDEVDEQRKKLEVATAEQTFLADILRRKLTPDPPRPFQPASNDPADHKPTLLPPPPDFLLRDLK